MLYGFLAVLALGVPSSSTVGALYRGQAVQYAGRSFCHRLRSSACSSGDEARRRSRSVPFRSGVCADCWPQPRGDETSTRVIRGPIQTVRPGSDSDHCRGPRRQLPVCLPADLLPACRRRCPWRHGSQRAAWPTRRRRWIQAGDQLFRVQGTIVSNQMEVLYYVDTSEGRPLNIEVLRAGQKQAFSITPVNDGRTGAWASRWSRRRPRSATRSLTLPARVSSARCS